MKEKNNNYAEIIKRGKELKKKKEIEEKIVITIPKQLQKEDFRFILLKKKSKSPIEAKWESENNYKFDNPKLLNHIKNGGNYGIVGGFGNLVIVDADSEEINEKCKLFPETFTIKSCCPDKHKHHYYFIGNTEIKPIRLSKEKVGDIGDVRSTGQYVVAPNCFAIEEKKGYEGFYNVVKDLEINSVSEDFVKTIFQDNFDIIASVNKEVKKKSDYKIDTTKRLSQFTKNCKVPDYVLNNLMPENISKNFILFPYVIDILNARDVSEVLYEQLAEKQNHKLSAVKGWVKNAKEGTLAKTSCKKMNDYLNEYTPDLVEDICGDCPLFKKIKEQKEKEIEIKKKLEKKKEIQEQRKNPHKEILELLENPDLLEIINKEFDKKIVKEYEARKTIFLVENMKNVANLGKSTEIL